MESSFLSSGAKVFNMSSPICLRVGDVGQEVERRGRYGKIEEDKEWKEMRKWAAEKFRGELGMVEMLECLEKEAIMGKDSGEELTVYDRRACIFDEHQGLPGPKG